MALFKLSTYQKGRGYASLHLPVTCITSKRRHCFFVSTYYFLAHLLTLFTSLSAPVLRANKLVLPRVDCCCSCCCCYVGCERRTHRKWWATGKLYFPFLSMSSLPPTCLPACPLAINVTRSYPPHTHVAAESWLCTPNCTHAQADTNTSRCRVASG